MKLPIYQVDAFTGQTFKGNPAAVVILDAWLAKPVLQAIAAENNLAETAFVIPNSNPEGVHQLRWFTPRCEVDLCGHATLAAAYVLAVHRGIRADTFDFAIHQFAEAEFEPAHVSVARCDDPLFPYQLNFPVRPADDLTLNAQQQARLRVALGLAPDDQIVSVAKSCRDLVVQLDTAQRLTQIQPNYLQISELTEELNCWAINPTGKVDDSDVDFASRFFAPRAGIDEDPVTGSAHCTLVPFWVERLGKQTLLAEQVSLRSGRLRCQLLQDRVLIAGNCADYLCGEIVLEG